MPSIQRTTVESCANKNIMFRVRHVRITNMHTRVYFVNLLFSGHHIARCGK
jgi:hypothetical protein